MFKNYYRYFSNMFCRPEIEAHFRNLLDKNRHVDVRNKDIGNVLKWVKYSYLKKMQEVMKM